MNRYLNWHLAFGPGLMVAFVAAMLLLGVGAACAQTPNPVTPGYQVCSVVGGITKCNFQPVGSDSVLGVAGLPIGAKAVTSCGGESYTNGVPYVLEQDLTGKFCVGGSGSGLSVVDQTAWTQGTSPFTPSGGVFNDAATLSTGQEGTYRLTTKRAQIVDVDTSSNALYSALTAPIPAGTNNIGSTNSASNVTLTDCSGTVVTGGTAVNAFTAQTTLHGFTIFNYDTGHNDEVLWVSFTTTAAASTAGSYPLPPATATTFAGGGSFTSPPGMGTNHALSVIAATSGHAFSCSWW